MAAAALAVGDIMRRRPDGVLESDGRAVIIRQLKHPAEVEALRAVYGPRFVLVGAWSPHEERRVEVQRVLQQAHPTQKADWYEHHATRLMQRDEKDAVASKMGQRVRDTYELADAYLALIPGEDVADQCKRLVNLLFGSPFETPHRHEQAMYQAAGASLRSSDAGRQVGAVVIDDDGEIVVSGTNEVPRALGGQYWAGEGADHRDFRYGYDENEKQKSQIVTDVVNRLRKSTWLDGRFDELSEEELGRQALQGPLKETRIADLLEFGRVAHAEMAAICTAARRGSALAGLTMYTTTYPCHECARLIIASGIRRVIYVDPYPKSQVKAMYKHEIVDDLEAGDRAVVFEPYRGIAPRLYRSVFTMTGRKRVEGKYPEWDPESSRPRLVSDAITVPALATGERALFQGVLEELHAKAIASSDSPSGAPGAGEEPATSNGAADSSRGDQIDDAGAEGGDGGGSAGSDEQGEGSIGRSERIDAEPAVFSEDGASRPADAVVGAEDAKRMVDNSDYLDGESDAR